MRLMWLPYYREDRLAGCLELARSENSLRAASCDLEGSLWIKIASVALVPGREIAAARVLLRQLQAWAQRLNYRLWPEFEVERWAQAIIALIGAQDDKQ